MQKEIITAILTLLIFNSMQGQLNFPERSVGIIAFTYNDSGKGKIKGTGFVFMQNDFVISAEHVLDGAGDYKSIFYNPFSDKSEFIPLEIYFVDKSADIVIFKSLNPITDDFLETTSFDELEPGDEIRYIGYNVDSGEFRTASEVILSKGKIKSNHINTEFINFRSDSVIGGYSGGPILSKEGNLVGMLSSTFYFSEKADSEKFKITRGFTLQLAEDKIKSEH